MSGAGCTCTHESVIRSAWSAPTGIGDETTVANGAGGAAGAVGVFDEAAVEVEEAKQRDCACSANRCLVVAEGRARRASADATLKVAAGRATRLNGA